MNDAPDNLRDPELSRLYGQVSQAEPPPALDAAILAAAQAATAPQRPHRPWWRRLQAPLALAATVVLAVVLSLSVDRNPPLDGEIPATTSGKERPPAAEQAAPATRNDTEAPPPGAPATGAPVRKETQRSQAAPEKPASRANLQDNAPLAAPTTAPSPPAYNAAKSVPAAAADTENTGIPANERRKALAEPAAAPALEAKREAAAALPQKSPEAWLEEIRSLRLQGRPAEAERSLREFRAAYPAYPLPEDLR